MIKMNSALSFQLLVDQLKLIPTNICFTNLSNFDQTTASYFSTEGSSTTFMSEAERLI